MADIEVNIFAVVGLPCRDLQAFEAERALAGGAARPGYLDLVVEVATREVRERNPFVVVGAIDQGAGCGFFAYDGFGEVPCFRAARKVDNGCRLLLPVKAIHHGAPAWAEPVLAEMTTSLCPVLSSLSLP